jgi:hypothetical protein
MDLLCRRIVMSFYKEAIEVIKAIIRGLSGDTDFNISGVKGIGRRFYDRMPRAFDRKQFLTTRLKIGLCSRFTKI